MLESCQASYGGLQALGADGENAGSVSMSRRGLWAMPNMKAFKVAIPNKFFAERELLALAGYERSTVKLVVNVKYFSHPCGKDISQEHGKDISHPFGKQISHPSSE